ncbi:hypothetical protein BDR26DRAFT_893580 [Obelidium mucronatum]|nr:hypothetical protein BDR26DRAFT_893580 [Obelidium mucronatum]
MAPAPPPRTQPPRKTASAASSIGAENMPVAAPAAKRALDAPASVAAATDAAAKRAKLVRSASSGAAAVLADQSNTCRELAREASIDSHLSIPTSTDSSNTTLSVAAEDSPIASAFTLDNAALLQNLQLYANPFWEYSSYLLPFYPSDSLDPYQDAYSGAAYNDCVSEFLTFSSSPKQPSNPSSPQHLSPQNTFVTSSDTPNLVSILTRTSLPSPGKDCADMDSVDCKNLPNDDISTTEIIICQSANNGSKTQAVPNFLLSKNVVDAVAFTPPDTVPGSRTESPLMFIEPILPLGLDAVPIKDAIHDCDHTQTDNNASNAPIIKPIPTRPVTIQSTHLKVEIESSLSRNSVSTKDPQSSPLSSPLCSSPSPPRTRKSTTKKKSKMYHSDKDSASYVNLPPTTTSTRRESSRRNTSMNINRVETLLDTPVKQGKVVLSETLDLLTATMLDSPNVEGATDKCLIRCLICQKPYMSKNGLRYHMKTQHA